VSQVRASQVLDASMTLAWLFVRADAGEAKLARKALSQLHRTPAVVPALWVAEVANGVLRGERAGVVAPAQAGFFLEELAHANITVDSEPAIGRQPKVVALARAYELTAYDAIYLDLALRMRSTLATFDRKLAQAARANGLKVFGDA
jgi:predicted nucleic acid-binding protein